MARLTSTIPFSSLRSSLPRTRLPPSARPFSKSTSIRNTASETASKAKSAASETASKAKSVASDTAGKAKQVLNQSSGASAGEVAQKAKEGVDQAQSQFSGYAEKLKELAGPVGKKLQGMLGGYADPLIYNARFVGAVMKQVYIAESLAPPKSLSSITSSYKTIYGRLTDSTYFPSLLKSGEWKQFAVYAVEAYGIFTIGEMLGRRSLVGYKLEKHGHAHH